jgi:hypothetical protein
MSRLLFAVCTLVLIESLAMASDDCCPRDPCDVCIESCDYGYHVGDRVSTDTHWTATARPRCLSCTTKASHLRCTSITASCSKTVKKWVCRPTIVTREFASSSCYLEPRNVRVEAAFSECRCCTDCCGRAFACCCLGPILCVDEPDFCPRPVTVIIEQSAKTIQCCEVKHDCEFKRVTTKCDAEDVEVIASTVGDEQAWTAEPHSVPTGIVTLETTPAIHVVPVACAHCAPCSLPCVGCKYRREACPVGRPQRPRWLSEPCELCQ